MIETDFFILTEEQFQEYSQLADEESVTLDYYLSEFCSVQGPNITIEKNTIATDGMPNDMILNDGN